MGTSTLESFARYPSLSGRVVFVSGGGSGIGAAIVSAFAENGARVAFVDIQDKASSALVEQHADCAFPPYYVHCDVTDIGALRSAIEDCRKVCGPISVLVNNAARDDRHEADDVTPEFWDNAIAVNLKHHFFAAQAVRQQMREIGGGSIINLSSIAWMFGAPKLPVYVASKSGIIGLTNSLAREFGPENIRVNAIAPGAVMTERQRQLWYKSAKDVEALIERQCLKTSLLPEDIARTVLFLASDDSRMITKQCITVDAGIR
jgi:D-xylose 1-dehydrogenase